jgi:ubiquinone/menaquinone biosynthesis C-methylase UbiE
MSTLTPRHLLEYEIVQSPTDPRRCVPHDVREGSTVLDVGCGAGQTLMAREFSRCAARYGIDIDAEAIEAGRELFSELDLRVGYAEKLPFADESFDLTFSRVALVYCDVPRALAEMFRVTRRGGRIWIAMHPWRMERERVVDAILASSARQLIDRAYVCANSLLLHFVGRSVPRPWSGRHESVQALSCVARMLADAGFVDVSVNFGRHLIASARRP